VTRYLFVLLLIGALPCSAPAAESKPLQPLELEDRPEPFVPKTKQTEADRYRQQALSHYAAGLMYDQQGNREEALRQYQRALRYDPTAAPVLQRVVEAAWALERHQEAIRYALKAAEVAPSNPELLERLAAFLIQENDMKRAVELYEKALTLQKDKEKTAGYIRLKMLVGQLYAQLDDYDRAAEAMTVVFHALQNPDDYGLRGKVKQTLEGDKGNGYALMGEMFLRVGRIDEAEAAFEQSYKMSSDDAMHAFQQAQVLEKRNRPAEALERLEEYFEAESDVAGSTPYEMLKRLLAATKKADELTAKLEALAKEDPKNVPLRYALAEEYRAAKDFDKAKTLFGELLRRSPSLDAYRGVLEASMETNDSPRIVEVLAEIVAKTGDLDAVETFVESLTSDEKQLAAFTAAAKEASMQGEPEDGKPAARAAASVLLSAKKYDEAAAFFELALLHDPKDAAPIYLTWGLTLLGDEKNDDAVKVFRRAVDDEASPDEPVFETYLALSLEFAGRTDEALDMMRKALKIGEGELRYEVRLPWILYHAKRYSEAAEAYQELIEKYDAERKSDDDRKLIREARLSMSNVYVMLNDFKRAEQPLEAILDEFPDDFGAMNDLGYLWADQNKNLELALGMVRRAVEAEPTNRAYRDSLGWVYFRLGRFAEAVVELEAAVKPEAENPDDEPDGVILDHLADAYAAAGRTEDARRTWQRAAKAFEKADDQEKLAAVRKKLK